MKHPITSGAVVLELRMEMSVNGNLSRMASHIDAPNPSHSATFYMINKSSSQATHYINNTTQ